MKKKYQIVTEDDSELDCVYAKNLSDAADKAFQQIKNNKKLKKTEEFKLFCGKKCYHFIAEKKDTYNLRRLTIKDLLGPLGKDENEFAQDKNFDHMANIESHGIDTSEFVKKHFATLQKNQS